MGKLGLEGQVALISGSGQGLGEAYAQCIASCGATVIINDIGVDSDAVPLASKVEKSIRSHGGNAYANFDSVASKEGVSSLVNNVMERFGKIDILIHNAGILRNNSFIDMTDREWNEVLDVHFQGAYFLTKAVYPLMVNQEYGRIVLVTSSAGLFGIPNQANYGAAKMGVIGLAQVLKTEIGTRNICCNLISPLAATNQTVQAIGPELRPAIKPEFVAPMVAYLCSPECRQSGNIYVAGGGYFSRIGLYEGKGIYIEPENIDVENIAERINEISDLSHATYISSTVQAGKRILKRAFLSKEK